MAGAAYSRCAVRGLKICMLSVVLVACTGQSAMKIAQRAQLAPQQAIGEPFLHQLFLNQSPARGVLHIYIEGDGRPWRTRKSVSLDPTPRTPLMLQLMAMDTAPALYLGRPCYFNLDDPQCSAQWWTHGRYSEVVVNSLDRVIDQFAGGYQGLVLFGHSGGGALAMLLARRRADVLSVVTLAGNLDIEAWAQFHGYSELEGSLNPARQSPLGREVQQLHLVGDRDTVTPPAMLVDALSGQLSPELRIIPEFDHACCWQQIWPALLAEVGGE